MATDDPKKFEWQKGQRLDDQNSKPLGGVRVKGLKKIEKSPLADPAKRAMDRSEVLSHTQSKNYKETIDSKALLPDIEDESFLIEESQSGVSQNFKPDEAKKIFDTDTGKEHQFEGAGRRFGENKPQTKKED